MTEARGAVWLEDPRPFFVGGYDMYMSVDEVLAHTLGASSRLAATTLCTGLMAIVPTPASLGILRAWQAGSTHAVWAHRGGTAWRG